MLVVLSNYNVLMLYCQCSLGQTLWLDPLVERERLPSIKKYVTKMCIRTLLIEKKYAETNIKVRYVIICFS